MTTSLTFKWAVVQFFAFTLVALFLSFPASVNAQNHDTSLCLNSDIRGAGEDGPVVYCDTPEQAHTGILNLINAQDRNSPKATPVYGDCGSFKCYTASIFNGVSMRSAQRLIVGGCPAGTEWFESLGKCDKPCSARNADLGGVNQPIKWADSSADQCIAECKYSIVSDYQTKNVVVSYGGQTSPAGTRYGGRWEYTGDRCPIPQSKPKEDEKPKQECTPATYGQTYCITPDNKECYSASTGRTICWGPSEQGTKTDGPTIQEHMPGQQTPSAPPNTTYNSTTTVTTNVNNNSSQTTTNNYTTNNNSPAGPSNNGEPANNNGEPTTPYNPYPGGNNGTGNGSGNGNSNGNDNASSGGGDCASPPVSSGDPLLAQIASQTWATRCAISDRNKQQDEQAESLKNADDGLGTVNESGIFGEGSDITGQLSESLIGGGGGQCATGWNLMGKPIELPDGFWSLASWIGMLIVALAYLWAAVLLSEG